MLPAIVLNQPEVDLDEGAPLGPFRLFDKMHPGFLRGAVCFSRVAADAGAHDVFPGCRPAALARDDVVEV